MCRRRRIRTPEQDARCTFSGSRIESNQGGAVHVLERDMTGLVADRVRIDLGRTQTAKEAQREEVAEERERAGVVGVQDLAAFDAAQAAGGPCDRLLPADGLDAALPLPPDAAARPGQPL